MSSSGARAEGVDPFTEPPTTRETAWPRTAIVVLNYENAEDTEACLDALHGVEYTPLDVVLVDNASSAACVARLEARVARSPGVAFRRSPRNLGYAGGNNVGIRAALAQGAEYVLVLNNDALVPPEFLIPLVEAMEADARIAIAMPRMLDESGLDHTRVRSRPTYGDYFRRFGLLATVRQRRGVPESGAVPLPTAGPPVEIEVPWGACMLLRASFLRNIGLLDEGTFLYQEEVILLEQVRARGLKVVLVPESRVTHLGGRSTRNYKLRRMLALWRSQNYYLRRYRGVGPFRRGLLIGYQAASAALLAGAGTGAATVRRLAGFARAGRS